MSLTAKIVIIVVAVVIVWMLAYFPVTEARYYKDGSIKMRFPRFLKLYNLNPEYWDIGYYGGPQCRIKKEPPQNRDWYIPEYYEYRVFLPYFSYIRYRIWIANKKKREQEKENQDLYNDFVTRYGAIVNAETARSKSELEAAIAEMQRRLREMSLDL